MAQVDKTVMFTKFVNNAMRGNLPDLNTATIKLALFTTEPNRHLADVFGDLTGETVSADYTAGGKVIGNTVVNVVENKSVLSGDAVEWTEATITARYPVVYIDGTTKYLIGYGDFGKDISSTDGTFKIMWHVDGIAFLAAEEVVPEGA